MSRVRYLAALGGAAGRRAPAPLLRPPRRLFPHEPPPLDASPPTQPAADRPVSEQPGARREPAAPQPVEQDLVEAVSPAHELRPEPSTAPPSAGPRIEQVVQSAGEDVAQSQAEMIRVLKAPQDARTTTRSTDSAPPARPEIRTKTASPALEPARVEVAHRSPASLAPRRSEPQAAAPPERVVAASRPAAAPARVVGLHVGAVEVVVTPPSPGPPEPVLAAPPPPVHQAPAPFASRSASTSRWFGLAQR